jgi:hypothetical protein
MARSNCSGFNYFPELVSPQSLDVSYFAQTPDGQRRGRITVDTRSQRVRSSIRLAEPDPVRVSMASIGNMSGERKCKYLPCCKETRCSVFKPAPLPDQAGIESDQRVICRPATVLAIFSPLNRLVDLLTAIHSSFSASVVYVCSKLRSSLVSFDERGMFMSSALNSAAFARYCSAENI